MDVGCMWSLFLEQNIGGKTFLWLHKLTHRLAFGIFLKH